MIYLNSIDYQIQQNILVFKKVLMKIITRYIAKNVIYQIVIKKDMIKQLINLAEFGIVPVTLSESVTV